MWCVWRSTAQGWCAGVVFRVFSVQLRSYAVTHLHTRIHVHTTTAHTRTDKTPSIHAFAPSARPFPKAPVLINRSHVEGSSAVSPGWFVFGKILFVCFYLLRAAGRRRTCRTEGDWVALGCAYALPLGTHRCLLLQRVEVCNWFFFVCLFAFRFVFVCVLVSEDSLTVLDYYFDTKTYPFPKPPALENLT